MAINTDLMYDVLIEAEAFPEIHAQGVWAIAYGCGTAYCMAGLAVALTENYQFGLKTADEVRERYGIEGQLSSVDVENSYSGVLPKGCTDWDREMMSIADAAQQALGLDRSQARLMFAGSNAIDDLWGLASEFTDGTVTRPPRHVVDEYRLHGSRIKKIDARFFKESEQ